MNFNFLRSSKFPKQALATFVIVSVASSVWYYLHLPKKIVAVPNEVQSNALELSPDQRLASRMSRQSQSMTLDPVSDSKSQELLGEKNNSHLKTEAGNSTTSTSIVTESGVQITTVSSIDSSHLAKSIFKASNVKTADDSSLDMKNSLVNTETENEKNFANNQNNHESFSSPSLVNADNKSVGIKNTNATKIRKEPLSQYDLLLAFNSPNVVQLKGRDVSIGGGDYQIKAGTRVLAFLPDKLIVTNSSSQATSLYVIGPMDNFTFPEGYIITANAKLNTTEDRIEIDTHYCSSLQNKSKSVSCSGVVKQVNGANGLSGEIYNETVWSAVAAFATSSLAAIPLSQITQASTAYGPIQSANVANSINAALAAGIQSIGQSIQKGFDKAGTQISIPQGAIVQILFSQDVIL